MNGDGFGDVIIGAPGNDAGATDAGRAFIYLGGQGADTLADIILTGISAGDGFGSSVSGAGDVNSDGYADAIVGAPHNASAGTDAGRAYLFYGGPVMDANADVAMSGAAAGDLFGFAVAA